MKKELLVLKHEIEVREIQRDDLRDMRKYFFESSPEFLNRIGLKTRQPGEAEEFQAKWEETFTAREAGGPPIPVFTVFYQGERVGYHTSTHREPGRSLIMHAHFIRPEFRGRGIGTVSYVLAIEKFLLEYGYQEVLFKTPFQNVAPTRIKEKLGMVSTGEEVVDWPVLIGPLKVRVYRVTRADLASLRAHAGL